MITLGIQRVDRWYKAVTRVLEFASDALAGISVFMLCGAWMMTGMDQIGAALCGSVALCMGLMAEVARLALELRWTQKLLRVTGAVRTTIRGVDDE